MDLLLGNKGKLVVGWVVWGVIKRWCLGLESRCLSSMSLARPMAWDTEYGLRMESSLRISGWSPEIKQLSIISGVSPTT